jgi:hypothetical protein
MPHTSSPFEKNPDNLAYLFQNFNEKCMETAITKN